MEWCDTPESAELTTLQDGLFLERVICGRALRYFITVADHARRRLNSTRAPRAANPKDDGSGTAWAVKLTLS
jgi:hypothetical protein